MSGNRLVPIGEPAPDFTASASDGRTIRLSEFRGVSNVILIFYPADFTPGCTAQLCRVRDDWKQFQESGAAVFGVNPSSATRHSGFVAKHNFPFPLIEDRGGAITRAYGCRMWLGITIRTVYAVDRQGRVVFAERGAPDTERILAALLGQDK